MAATNQEKMSQLSYADEKMQVILWNPPATWPSSPEEIKSNIQIPGNYFFYASHPQNKDIQYAEKIGRVTVNEFVRRFFPDYLVFNDTPIQNIFKDPEWLRSHMARAEGEGFAKCASQQIARNAQGHVMVMLPSGVGMEKTWGDHSYFAHELPLLQDNPKVKTLRRIDLLGVSSYMIGKPHNHINPSPEEEGSIPAFVVDHSDNAVSYGQQALDYFDSVNIQLDPELMAMMMHQKKETLSSAASETSSESPDEPSRSRKSQETSGSSAGSGGSRWSDSMKSTFDDLHG